MIKIRNFKFYTLSIFYTFFTYYRYTHTCTFQAMGVPAQMIEDHLLVLNEFAKGFTADELGQISFTSNEVIESFGRVRGYDSTQINKMWKAVKGGRSMSSFNGSDLAVLGVIAYGMTTAELSTVELTAYQYVC